MWSLLGEPHQVEALFASGSQQNLREQTLLALLALGPGHRPALWPSTLPYPAFPRAHFLSRLLPPTQITTHSSGSSSCFLTCGCGTPQPGRHLTICCRLLFWGFSLGMTLVFLTRQLGLPRSVISLLLLGEKRTGWIDARMTEWVPLSQVSVHVLPCLCLTLDFELLLGDSLPKVFQPPILRVYLNEHSLAPKGSRNSTLAPAACPCLS